MHVLHERPLFFLAYRAHYSVSVPTRYVFIKFNYAPHFPPEDSLRGAIYAGWNGIDEFGRRWEHGRYVGGAVANRDDLRKYSPEPKLSEPHSRPLMEDCKKNYSDHAFALFSHSGPLGLTIEAFGLIDFCYALFDKRALIQESAELKTEWFIVTSKYAVELGVDFVVMGDDMGFKGHGYVSPSDFRELALNPFMLGALNDPTFTSACKNENRRLAFSIKGDLVLHTIYQRVF